MSDEKDESPKKVIISENPGEISEKSEQLGQAAAGTTSEDEPDVKTKNILDELDEKRVALEEQKDKYLRLFAEFDNFKKRKEEEKKTLLKMANEKMLKEFLTVLDSFEQALLSISEKEKEESTLAKGMELIYKQIEQLVLRHHVAPIEALGKKFDPNYHSAIKEEEDNENEPGTVIKEIQKGYLFHGKILRPTMAIISKNNK